MKYEKKFSSQEQHEHVSESQSQARQTIHEFALPEDALRFDAKQTTVPERVAERLNRSVQRHPVAARPWWRRWF